MRVLGVDYGAARIGLALGDTETRIATPWGILDRKDDEQAIRDILARAKTEGAETVVVGIPRPLRDPNAVNEQRASVERFIEALRVAAADFAIAVESEDEMLTTALGDRLARDADRSGPSDDLAASAILETWLMKQE